MKKKLIKEPVFETYCWFVWDATNQELKKWVKKNWNYTIETKETLGKMIVVEDGRDKTKDWIVWTINDNWFEIVHETTHLIFDQMRFNEIPIKKDTEEVFIRLQAFYLREIAKIFRKNKSKRKKAKNGQNKTA